MNIEFINKYRNLIKEMDEKEASYDVILKSLNKQLEDVSNQRYYEIGPLADQKEECDHILIKECQDLFDRIEKETYNKLGHYLDCNAEYMQEYGIKIEPEYEYDYDDEEITLCCQISRIREVTDKYVQVYVHSNTDYHVTGYISIPITLLTKQNKIDNYNVQNLCDKLIKEKMDLIKKLQKEIDELTSKKEAK